MEVHEINQVIVDFGTHCQKCKHKDKKESESPCCDCLDVPVNTQSNKPIKWEKQ